VDLDVACLLIRRFSYSGQLDVCYLCIRLYFSSLTHIIILYVTSMLGFLLVIAWKHANLYLRVSSLESHETICKQPITSWDFSRGKNLMIFLIKKIA